MSREKDSYAVEVKTEISLSRSQVLGLYTMLMTAAAIIKKVDPDLSEEIMTSHSFELFEDFLQRMGEEKRHQFFQMVPLGRLGKMEEYASLAAYLAGDYHYLVGQIISPNGGMF